MEDNSDQQAVDEWVPTFPQAPATWALSPFNEVFSAMGINDLKIPQKDYLTSGKWPIVDQGAAEIGGYTNDASKLVRPADAVLVFGDHTRCLKFLDREFAPGADGVKVLVPNDGHSPRYLYYLLSAIQLPNRGYSRHYGFLRRAILPIAPLAEQHRIVAKLEEMFSSVDKAVDSLMLAKEQLKTYRQILLDSAIEGRLLNWMGEWGEPLGAFARRPLGELILELGQGWSPQCHNYSAATDEAWAVMKTTAIQHLSFNDQENKALPDTLKPRPQLELRPGDLLITRAGPRSRVGVACLVRGVRPRVMLCDKAYRLRVREDLVLPEYLELVLNSPRILWDIEQLKTGINDSGVNLTQAKLVALHVPVPSLEQQRRILKHLSEVLSRLERLDSDLNTALAGTAALRRTILKSAFSGHLVPHKPSDEPAATLRDHAPPPRSRRERAA